MKPQANPKSTCPAGKIAEKAVWSVFLTIWQYGRYISALITQPAQTLEQRCMDVETTFKR